jgi:methionyl-tRNA formyltransferase
MKALFLGNFEVFTSRVLWSWLNTGNQVAEFWCPRKNISKIRADRLLGLLRPGWSVSRALKANSIPLRTVGPLSNYDGLMERLNKLSPDILMVASFPYIVPGEMIRFFPEGAFNFHPSLLPHYRGPAPMIHMVMNNEQDIHGGVTLHLLDPEVDAGHVIGIRRAPWPEEGSYRAWLMDISRSAGELARTDLISYLQGEIEASPQDGPGSYFPTIPGEGLSLDPGISLQELRRILLRFRGYLNPAIRTAKGGIRVTRILNANGKSPGHRGTVLTRRTLDLDISDGRVRLRRAGPWTSLVDRARYFFKLAGSNPELKAIQ